MASISSLTSSGSSSSVYGNRTYNIISGLASGLDTESLISGAIQGYQQKIQNLQKENTTLQWQQEAYQSISDKLVEFYRNYSSYVYSNTNLASSSFFNSAVSTTTSGTYANLVTASGKTSSTVVLNAVKQLATTARYTHSGDVLNINSSVDSSTKQVTVNGESMSNLLTDDVELSKLSGSLTLNYGDRTVSIDFGERDLFTKDDGSFDAAGFRTAIESALKDQQISTSDGTMVTADTRIGVSVQDDGTVSFYDKSGAGNSVSINDATGNLAGMIENLDSVVDSEAATFTLDLDENNGGVTETKAMAEYLSGKTITLALDGKSKTIELPKVEVVMDSEGKADVDATNGKFVDALNKELQKAFGDRVTAAMTPIQAEGSGDPGYGLSFTLKDAGSTLSVTSSSEDVADVLGIGSGLTSYVDTTRTLGELLKNTGLDWAGDGEVVMGVGSATQKKDADGNLVYDAEGNPVYVDEEGNLVNENNQRLGQDGEVLYSFDVVINGATIGSYHRDTELNTVINAINSNTEAGVSVSYSKTTGQFVFTAKDTGAGGRVEINETIPAQGDASKEKTNLGALLFGTVDPSNVAENDPNYTKGQDAQFIATINGQVMELTRSSNSFDIDGMNITVSGTFNEDKTASDIADAVKNNKLTEDLQVTFTSKSDADKIVEVVKKMVEDLNTLIKEVKNAYSDMPLKKTDGSTYEPLTDEDMEGMSESAIETYEEKAKTGILFMDNDLSSLYNDLRNAITSSGADGVTLRSMGIETAYSDGLTTLTFDEQKFREALESDPDKVQEAFTKSKENGAATNGLMASLTAITDKYADTDGDVKGILIEKAGSQYSPSAALDNDMLDQMKEVEEEISKWQDKMSNQVDYYTNKFTQLELLINQMNSQSSALSGLMGG